MLRDFSIEIVQNSIKDSRFTDDQDIAIDVALHMI